MFGGYWLLEFDEKTNCARIYFVAQPCNRKRKTKRLAQIRNLHQNFLSNHNTIWLSWFCFISRLQLLPPVSVAASGHFDAPPASPLWSFCGTPVPTPVWQCFQLGCRIRFLLPNTETPWQKAEVLALKDHEAMKIDSRNSYQYAPNGLVLVQVRNMCTVDR